MLAKTLITLFTRDLTKLKKEMELYHDESRIWIIDNEITNSAGNLCLHLIGNLNGFIGTELGKTGYVRNRALEFSLKNVPRNEMIEKIDATIAVVSGVLETLTDEILESDYPLLVFKEPVTTKYFLLHLSTHLSYHLGQINYHRRLLDN